MIRVIVTVNLLESTYNIFSSELLFTGPYDHRHDGLYEDVNTTII
jgi:hypothetical protein